MRPLEVLLTLINLATFLALAIPRLRTSRATRFIPFGVLLAAAHIVSEGARWQMAPAYAVSVLLLFLSLVPRMKGAEARASLWRIAGSVSAAIGTLVLALSCFLPLAFPVFRFPSPTGPYAIGTLTYHWVDAARRELFTADPNDRRELMVQIWYPAKANASAPRASYLRDGAVLAPLAHLLHLPGFACTHLKYDMTNAMPSAPMADGRTAFPVAAA
jgi:hypothetical protein